MRYLFLFLLVLSSCTSHYQTNADVPIKFKFGTRVYVADGFYTGCKGYVKRWYGDQVIGITYTIDALCYSEDRKLIYTPLLDVKEDQIIEDTSE